MFAESPDTTPASSTENHAKYTSIAPNHEDVGAQSPTNKHISRLGGILLTYNFFEKELGMYPHCTHEGLTPDNSSSGYVQGMSDLCGPIYIVLDSDEEMTFWCFVKVMERMVKTRNYSYCTFRCSQPYTERQLPTRPERDETATVDFTTAHRFNGP